MAGQYLEYDLIVIGSGPAGQKAALRALPRGADRAPTCLRWLMPPYGHHPEQNPPGSRALLHGSPAAQRLRFLLIVTELKRGRRLLADALLFAIGRQGATDELNLATIGLDTDERGRIQVNDAYQTTVEHIYAAGDVIGFPGLAATSMEQGRLAASQALGMPCMTSSDLAPFAIWTIPEISMVGETEEHLSAMHVPYESGSAHYRDVAKELIVGDEIGMLKLLFHSESRQVLGVHAIGTRAAEIIHIGQAVMACHGTIDYFVDTVFNYPTLVEAYEIAALDGLNKLRNG